MVDVVVPPDTACTFDTPNILILFLRSVMGIGGGAVVVAVTVAIFTDPGHGNQTNDW